ncbi:hypothetical protein P8452_75397 [Trifolium repens]|nr:hypothetical protein P8452_75397 [Trifolium repens]
MAVSNVERQFFKVGPNSSTDPHIDAFTGEIVSIRDAAAEMELPNVARFAEGEHRIHEECKLSELVRPFADTFGVIREVEDLLMLPKRRLGFKTMSGVQLQSTPSVLTVLGSQSVNEAHAAESKPKKKICCACPDTKKLRDECIVEHGEEACGKWIEAHKQCLRAEGFNV